MILMVDNTPTELAKVIEFLHRRGVIGPNADKNSHVNVGMELAQLAYGSKWDVDDFMMECGGKDYGFDVRQYLFSNIDEICQEEHLQVANKVNARIFNFPGDFTIPKSYIPEVEEYAEQDYTGQYIPEP